MDVLVSEISMLEGPTLETEFCHMIATVALPPAVAGVAHILRLAATQIIVPGTNANVEPVIAVEDTAVTHLNR